MSQSGLDPRTDRSKGLGASEIGPVAGVDHRRRPIDVWEAKTGLVKEFEGNHHTRRGQYLEPALLKWLGAEAGVAVLDARGEDGTQETFHGSDPLVFATPDGFVLDDHGDAVAVVDVKAPHRTWTEWFDDAGRIVIPDTYVCQLAWQINAVQEKRPKVTRGLIGALLDGQIRWKWIERDPALEADLLGVAREFWGYVERREPPPVDGSASYEEFLRRRFPHATRPLLDASAMDEKALADAARWLRNADEARRKRDSGEAGYREAKNYLGLMLGESGGLVLPGVGKVTWKNNKDGDRVDWEAMAQELLALQPDERAAELSAKHTHKTNGARVMRVKMDQE